jgi:riboflavin synthase
MFTGLIEEVGRIIRIDHLGAGAKLHVASTLPLAEICLGDSIAVNGVCLTVVAMSRGQLSFDVSPESMSRTIFKNLRSGVPVNLERALRLGDRLGGHLVSGHVDCIALVTDRREVSGNLVFSFRVPERYCCYLIEKGSIAIDGISLTINTVFEDGFAINVIPHTAGLTTLRNRGVGDEVNIETDLIGKYVERLLGAQKPVENQGVSLELLAKSGFL